MVPRSPAFLLYLASTINAFGAGMVFPFALLYYQEATGLTVGEIGATLSIATAIGLLANPVTGILVDHFGARRLVVASQLIEAAGFVGYLLVDSRLSLLLAAIVATAGARVFFASFSTYIAERSTGRDTDLHYARTSIAQTIGSTTSGTIAAIMLGILGSSGFHVTITTNIICLVTVAMLIARTPNATPGLRPSEGSVPGLRDMARHRAFIALVIANGGIVTCTMFWGIGSVVYATETVGIPLPLTSATGIASACLLIAVQTRITRRLTNVPRLHVLACGYGLHVVAFSNIALAAVCGRELGFMLILIGSIVLTIGTMSASPVARGLAVSLAPAGMTGRYVATYELSWGIAAVIAPVAFGRAWDSAPSLPWIIAACLSGMVAMAFAITARKHKVCQ